jgi:prolyl-tRNA synthetase
VAVRGEFGDLDFAVEEGGSQVTRDAASIYIPQPDETLYPIEEVHTPGQSSIEELCKGLSIEAENTCKLMLLRCTDEEKLIAVLIRGDLDLNVQALSQYYSPGAVFSKATDEELRIAGFEPGYGSMMGVLKDNVSLYVDHSVANGSFVVGANRENYHLKNWNFQRDLNFGEIGRFSLARQGHFHGESRYPWQFFPGLELGKIHQVKKDILQSYGFEYMTKEGKTSVLNCCCLQLDLFRILAASCELNSDKFGPIWSPFLSPFDVHICILDKKQESLTEADLLYEKLSKSGFRVLMDDRIESPGVQFAEADLLGAPVRVIISAKNLKSSKVELAQRGVKDRTLVDKGFAQKAISNLWDEVVCSG